MKLSVIIVNYNVKYFLEQCLISVFKSGKSIDMEVFVVDNASADGSCQMVKQRFPSVKLIENSKNVGFSIANNQAIKLASGDFLLLLNPDTVVEEDTFTKCISFMEEHTNAGSLSVKMIDGKGKYLPESKRGLPTPIVSFYKIIGLTKLFPRSKTFARYYLGHLNENQTSKIEILPGAFMFIRKEVIEKVGLLDESFFMYGEDIDLSYRILKANYENYYYPETRIIHYKGESTKKGSINYVIVFYKAMVLFAKKHFNNRNIRLFMAIVFFAIYFRAFISILKRVFKNIYLQLIDIILITSGFLLIVPFWENFWYHNSNYYPTDLVLHIIPLYILIWVLSLWLAGAYDMSQKLFASTKGILSGLLIILAIYALLPLELRFSRAIILLSSGWSLITLQSFRMIVESTNKNLIPSLHKKKRIAIVGTSSEEERALQILRRAEISFTYCGLIAPSNEITSETQIASMNQLDEVIRINQVDEVIFCSRDISSQDIIRNMLVLSEHGIEYKIAPPESHSIIGSNSINAIGELYTPDVCAINTPANKRNKRLFDLGSSALILITFFIWVFIKRDSGKLFANSLAVLIGKKTWIGYRSTDNIENDVLPRIRKSVYSINSSQAINDKEINLIYAKSYSVKSDLSMLWKNLTN